MSLYHHSDGRPSLHPTSRNESKRLRRLLYDSGTVCDVCSGTPLCYTYNGRCVHCARLAALDYYNDIVESQIGSKSSYGGGGFVALNIGEARHDQVPNWYSPDACNKAGHVGLRTLDGGCQHCQDVANDRPISPRQKAIANGEKWYAPVDPCPQCGTTALRYVANGRCVGCQPIPTPDLDPRTPAEVRLIRDFPGITFSKRMAIKNGIGIYRTGDPCSRGHTTYRAVKGDACISCR